MNRKKRESIKRAITELNGELPTSQYDIEDHLVKMESGGYILTAGLISDAKRNVCSKYQFERVARKMGYQNINNRSNP